MFYQATEKQKSYTLTAAIIAIFSLLTVIALCKSAASCSRCAKTPLPDNAIDTSEFIDARVKNNIDLATWAKIAYDGHWGYVWGTYGCILNKTNLSYKVEQYPEAVGSYYDFIVKHWMNRRVTDCVGLIKGYSWYDTDSRCFGYDINGMHDVGANGMYNNAVEKGDISTLPETVGIAVWKEGHIGVYIGDGKVIEARGTEEGVIMSRLTDVEWTAWLKIPYIEYY